MDLTIDREEQADIYEFIMLVPENYKEVVIHEIDN